MLQAPLEFAGYSLMFLGKMTVFPDHSKKMPAMLGSGHIGVSPECWNAHPEATEARKYYHKMAPERGDGVSPIGKVLAGG